VKLTTHLNLVQTLRICGAITPLSQYVFVVWCLIKHSNKFISCNIRIVLTGSITNLQFISFCNGGSIPILVSMIAQSVERLVTGWTIGVLEFHSRRGMGDFSLRHHIQTGSGAHPASYPMGTEGYFPGDKAAGA
jgi:hypothetical protein